jgi:uncharacterized membrane protein
MLDEWLNLLLRWGHVFAGILWIGQTWLFLWMDQRFEDAAENPGGQVFMVHSGGFYVVEKKRALDAMPKTLYWFKWEAGLTWLTGIALLLLVYYRGGLLVAADSDVSETAAMAVGLTALPLAWLVYDQLWERLARLGNAFGFVAAFVLVELVALGLSRVLSGRAAWMHVGAVLGTLMAWNVWIRIIPAQAEMVASIREGRPPDTTLGERARQRSKHNTFMVVPLVLIMLSNHFPTITYGQTHGWAVLGAVLLAGWAAAAVIRKR